MKKMTLTCAALIGLMTGCVSSSAHQAALNDLNLEKNENSRLKGENSVLKTRVDGLETQKEDLQRKIAEAQSRVQVQSEDSDRLAQKNIELSGDLANLTRQKNELSQTVQTATLQLESLNRQADDLKKRLAEEARRREEEINRFKGAYDRLVGEFQSEINAGEITIVQFTDRLSVHLAEKILFDSGQAEIKPDGLKVIKRMGGILKTIQNQQILIEGHTDNVPIGSRLTDRFPTNWELSSARAISVVRYLTEKAGVESRYLAAAGFADAKPVASNDTAEGRSQNRRIGIVLLPLESNEVLKRLKPTTPTAR